MGEVVDLTPVFEELVLLEVPLQIFSENADDMQEAKEKAGHMRPTRCTMPGSVRKWQRKWILDLPVWQSSLNPRTNRRT